MPDLRQKRQAKARERRHKRKGPGNNNQLPNNEIVDSAGLPGDVARDVSNAGVAFDPADKPHRFNP